MKKGPVFFLAAALFAAGLLLFIINLAGFFIPLRGPGLQEEEDTMFVDDVTLGPDEFFSRMEKIEELNEAEFIRESTMLVNKAVAHYWSSEGMERYRMRAPLWENYILYAKSFTEPEKFRPYEFIDWRRAVERGVGLCSQQAMIIQGLLEDRGIESYIIPLGGHVVAGARTAGGKGFVLDADYGVVIPHDIIEIMKSPDLVKPYYRDTGVRPGVSAMSADEIAAIYGPEGNYILPGAKDYKGPYLYYMEIYSYAAKWIIPVLLVLPFMLLKMNAIMKKKKEFRAG